MESVILLSNLSNIFGVPPDSDVLIKNAIEIINMGVRGKGWRIDLSSLKVFWEFHIERQNMLWYKLDKILDEEKRLKIIGLLTMTPAEEAG